jgi:Septum formation
VRRLLVAAALGTVAALTLAGCGGRPPGVDGNLTNNWPAMPEPKLPVPADHACYALADPSPGETRLPSPVDCTVSHNLETFHVGAFTGGDASADDPPPDGGPAQQQAYADCSAAARTFLGDDWRTGRLGLDLVVPTAVQWEAEARWYRCDLVEFKDLDSYGVADRTGSVKDTLAGARPLGLGCFQVTTKSSAVDSMAAVDCGTGHNGEFAGIWDAPAGDYPTDPSAREKTQLDGCRGVIAGFAGIPNDDKFRYRVGQITYGFGKADWQLGNRGVRCYIWMDSKTVNRSLRGVGTAGLPINYA